jgi:hypothetical protein
MRQPGRKSAASLSIVQVGETPRPEPRRQLSREEKAIWRSTTARFPPAHFIGAEILLEVFCRAVAMERWLDELIRDTDPADHKRLGALIRLHAAEGRMVGNVASKLRMSPSARWDRFSTKVRPVSNLPKPWELGQSIHRFDDDEPPPVAS